MRRVAVRIGAGLRGLLLVLACAGAAAAPVDDEASMRRALTAARDAIGVDIVQAQRELAALRERAVAARRVDWRLAVDEIDCRLQTDLDPARALATADAGLAAAEREGISGYQPDLLRLRACRGAMLQEVGRVNEGEAELDDVIARASAPDAAAALGLARLERGVKHSRAGRWEEAQADLHAACEGLVPWPRELELCRAQLSHHLRRIGDYDESLRLLLLLRDEARQRGAAFDEGIYVLLIAHLRGTRGDYRQALVDYQAARDHLLGIGDRTGARHAELGAGRMLRLTGRPAESLRLLQSLPSALDDTVPGPGAIPVRLETAESLIALGRHAEAAALLASIEKPLRAERNALRLRDWLLARSGAFSGLGDWSRAWDALDEWHSVDTRLQMQRQAVQTARLQLQFGRERDAQEVDAQRRLAEQGAQLRRTQAATIALAVLLLLLTVVYGAHKLRQGRRLQRLADTDELTGLPNRRALLAWLDDALVRAQRAGQPLALLMVDVDHFKRINDTHGHAVGDAVLRELARVLPGVLRAQDCLGRLGGEEFVAVLPEATIVQALTVAERMREAVHERGIEDGRDPALPACRISIGVAGARRDDDAGALLSRADEALYRAKESGRDRVTGPAELDGA